MSLFKRRRAAHIADGRAEVEAEERRQHRERTRVPSWRDRQGKRRTSRGTTYTDVDFAERMSIALIGERPDRAGQLFMDCLASAMANGSMAYRVWQTAEAAPARLEGTDRLTTRAQFEARSILGKGEDRGPQRPAFPFRPTLIKPGQSAAPLHHGHLVVDRGFEMAVVGSSRARRLRPTDFPSIPTTGWAHRSLDVSSTGLPLVVGTSSGAASWALLAERGALAVWHECDLWTFRALEPFAAPLDELRRRVAPPSIR